VNAVARRPRFGSTRQPHPTAAPRLPSGATWRKSLKTRGLWSGWHLRGSWHLRGTSEAAPQRGHLRGLFVKWLAPQRAQFGGPIYPITDQVGENGHHRTE